MKTLNDCKKIIRHCSKCGLCQSVCPIFDITKNDCTVSRGHFIMLQGLLKGEIKTTKKINHYLDLCLKCGACTKFCPSGIDIVDVNLLAKSECIKNSFVEKIISFFLKYFVFGYFLRLISIFKNKTKSKTFEKKVVYFGGCGSKLKGNSAVIKLLNLCDIELLTPNFECCGIPFLMRGDINSFLGYINKFIEIINNNDVYEIVTTCASCEKAIKDYIKWSDNPTLKKIRVKNLYEYIRENNLKIELKNKQKVTFHKPCNIENWEDISWILKNTKNLEYLEIEKLDSCCGLNGVLKFREYNVFKEVFKNKRNSILKTGSKLVLTSCLGCEVALKAYSFNQYKVQDLIDFLGENI